MNVKFAQDIKWLFLDTYMMTWRNLIRYTRLPRLLVFSTIQPVMFVILFAYVFGGAIQVPGVNYIDYLIPGILIQSAIFGSTQTGVGLSEDLSEGMIDRFNSLPISRAAVLAGRTISDTIRNIFVVILMILVGFLIGFRFHDGILNAFFALFLVILFGFAFSWVSANVGLLAKEAETAQVGGFIWVFPLVFASSIFVPIETMPSWLKVFAENSPITITVNAVRSLSLGGATFEEFSRSLLWIIAILIIFVPLAIYNYKRRA